MNGRRLGLRKRLALNIFSDLYRAKAAEHRLDTLFWECTLRCKDRKSTRLNSSHWS